MSTYLIDGGSHIDTPLSNLAVKAFDGGGDFIAGQLFPAATVGKQSDGYYVIDKDSWLRVPDTKRSPKSPANRVEWKASTDTYFANNYALATDHAKETLANADQALSVRETSTSFVVENLQRDLEVRVANKVTSISNVGSGVSLTGANKWSDYANSDPISAVNTGHAFIENLTGLHANVCAMDKDTHRILRHHPVIRDYTKYTGAGPVPDAMLAELFEVDRILIARGIKNNAKEGDSASITNIWGNNFLLAHIRPAVGLQTMTFGIGMRWAPEGFPAPFVVERYDHHDKSKKAEVVEAQYFQDEKIVAQDLSYLIAGTL